MLGNPKRRMKWVILCAVCMVGSAIGGVINKLDREKRSSASTSSTENEVPTIICPKVPTQFVYNGTSTAVTWTPPIGRDKDGEELTVQRKGPASGSQFMKGSHVINYHVTDKNNITASCEVVISVKGINCSILQQLHPTLISEIFQCDPGFEIQSNYTLTCGESGWAINIPECQVKSCGPVPKVEGGAVRCFGGNVYGATCLLQCNDGYESEGQSISECSDSGQWTNLGPCLDMSPPNLTNCPEDITSTSSIVDWPHPVVEDNSGDFYLVYSHSLGSPFPVGSTTVTIIANDFTGNTAECTFTVTVLNEPPQNQ